MVWRIIKTTFRKWFGGSSFQYAAALAYYTLFSIAPILLIAIVLAGLFLGQEAAQGLVYEKSQRLIGPEAADLLQKLIYASALESDKLHKTIIGIGLLILGATGLFAQLQKSLNEMWSVKTAPTFSGVVHFLLSRFISLLLVLGIGLLMVVSLLATTTLDVFSTFLSQYFIIPAWVITLTNGLVSFGILSVLLGLIYKFLPDVELRRQDVVLGSVVTTSLLLLGRFGIAFYLSHATVAGAFGAAGTLAVFILWVYYSALIFFLGMAFTQAYVAETGRTVRPNKHAVWVRHVIQTTSEPPKQVRVKTP